MDSFPQLNQLVQAVRRQMAAVAWRILRDTHEAEDAIQDTLMNLWARRRKVLAHPNPPALIVRMCFQCAMDRLRRRRHDAHPHASLSLTSSEPAPMQTLLDDESRQQVLHHIAALPPQQADAIYLRVVEQMPYADVAAALGCEESTARVHVRRARETLKLKLAHLMPNEVCHDEQR